MSKRANKDAFVSTRRKRRRIMRPGTQLLFFYLIWQTMILKLSGLKRKMQQNKKMLRTIYETLHRRLLRQTTVSYGVFLSKLFIDVRRLYRLRLTGFEESTQFNLRIPKYKLQIREVALREPSLNDTLVRIFDDVVLRAKDEFGQDADMVSHTFV